MESLQLDVAIPVYKPGVQLHELIKRIEKQSISINKIYLLHTEDGENLDSLIKQYDNLVEIMIDPEAFDHGATRHLAMELSTASIMVFMTQDALPADRQLISELIKPLQEKEVAMAYARQLPRVDSRLTERVIRQFNYPPESRIKSIEDLPVLGIKTYFCSNVCAAYKRKAYMEVGGFETHIPLNEDMLYAAKCMKCGWKISYAAGARVIHSHNYTYKQQFKRNFDIAVSQTQYPEIFRGISSEKEGASMVIRVLHILAKRKILLIPYFLGECAAKFIGFQMGKHYKSFPLKVVKRLSLNSRYWR